jgi:hypothetical protein
MSALPRFRGMSALSRLAFLHGSSIAAGLALALAIAATGAWCAGPRWSIERPIEKGKQSPLAAAPLQKRTADDKALAERYPVTIERIDVEGVRDPDARPEPPRTTEQRFAARLNEGSPELIAGRSYDGYYYDGTLFWASDPLSFAWKNITHWLSH